MPPRPMLATLSAEIPEGPEWVFEEKYDGIRALAVREKGAVRLWSRTLQDLTGGFPDVAAAAAALPDGDLILDGELVALDPKGVSRFQLLQRRGTAGAARTRGAGSNGERPVRSRSSFAASVARLSRVNPVPTLPTKTSDRPR